MAEESAFRGVLEFFNRLGVYDVILPFILIFTVVFAILEKTKIFGTDKIDNVNYSKKNLNAMVAFSIAFFVVASSKLVGVITKMSSNMVILLFLIVFVLLLVGSFHEETEKGFFFEKGFMRTAFIGIVFIGMIAIFLDALGWLEIAYNSLLQLQNNVGVASAVLMIITIGAMAFVFTSSGKGSDKKKEG